MQEIAINIVSAFQRNAKKYQPEVATGENAKYVRDAASITLRNAHAALRAEKRSEVARRAALMEPMPAASSDLTFERDFIGRLDAMQPAQRMAALTGELSINHTSALLRYSDLRRLIDQPAVIERVERAHVVNRITQIAGDRFPARPTASNPLPTGIDHVAARAFAEAELDGLNAQIVQIDDAGHAWAGLVKFASIAAGLDPETMFADVAA